MEEEKRILFLLDHYTAGQCTDDELAELFEYISTGRYDHILEEHIDSSLMNASVAGNNLDATRSDIIMHKILSTSHVGKAVVHHISAKKFIWRMAGVAAVVAIIVVSMFFVLPHYFPGSQRIPVVASLQTNSKRVINNTDQAMQLQLPDGSMISLQPSSALIYPLSFASAKREVILEGNAFFDIAGNPKKPFLVYHGSLVTKVLGTSFNIRYDNQEHEAEVEVLSGKVEVSENTGIKEANAKSRNNGVIITPNQKAIYTERQRIFSTTLVDSPMPVVAGNDGTGNDVAIQNPATFRFVNSNMNDIIQSLCDTYKIDIDMENKEIGNCRFSGDISDQNLFSKLDILCQAMGIDYEVKGTRILLTGKGCK